VWGPYVLFYLVRKSGEPLIGESEDCEQKVGEIADVAVVGSSWWAKNWLTVAFALILTGCRRFGWLTWY